VFDFEKLNQGRILIISSKNADPNKLLSRTGQGRTRCRLLYSYISDNKSNTKVTIATNMYHTFLVNSDSFTHRPDRTQLNQPNHTVKMQALRHITLTHRFHSLTHEHELTHTQRELAIILNSDPTQHTRHSRWIRPGHAWAPSKDSKPVSNDSPLLL